jgi:TonB family protein
MAVAIATVRRPRLGPALRRARLPVGGLVLSTLFHGALVAAVLLAGHVWRTSQPKTYVVNLVPAIAAVGSPQGQTRAPEPTLPRTFDPAPPRPTPAPALPDREPERAPERAASRPTDLPDRTPAPRESVALPDRALPARAPALPRPGEKELPRVASTPPPPPTPGPVGRAATPAPPPPLGRPTGSPQGAGALTLNAADFPFAWYLRQVQGKISKEWEGQARDGAQPQVVFEIGRDGKIAGLKVEKSSGNPLYDQAALRAITDATPFPPLPEEFKETFLRVHLGFTYSGTRG